MVSSYVHRPRKEIIGDSEGKVLVYRAPGYRPRIAPGDVDIQVFESLVASGRAALAAGDPERAAGLLSEALGLWRGPVAGWPVIRGEPGARVSAVFPAARTLFVG